MRYSLNFLIQTVLFSLLFSFSSIAQEELDIYEQETGEGKVALFATNAAKIPLTVEIGFNTLKNLRSNVELPATIVVPAGGSPVQLVELTVIDYSKSPEYDFRFNYTMGDIYATHDDSFVYLLPYKPGTTYKVHQGYHGNYSHKHIYALDFNMPIGTDVYAARGGIVSDIKENSNTGCSNPSCNGKSNYLVIAHDDGSFSNYVHMKYNGALVQVGDRIEAGQVIAKSGNTGWSSGPHLHFEVYTKTLKKNKTVPTTFKMASGTGRIDEGGSYKSAH